MLALRVNTRHGCGDYHGSAADDLNQMLTLLSDAEHQEDDWRGSMVGYADHPADSIHGTRPMERGASDAVPHGILSELFL